MLNDRIRHWKLFSPLAALMALPGILPFMILFTSHVGSAAISPPAVHIPTNPLSINGKPIALTDGTIRFTGTIHTHGKNFIVSALGTLHVAATALAWPAARPRTFSVRTLTSDGSVNFWHDSRGTAHLRVKNGVTRFQSLRMKNFTFTHGIITWSLLHHAMTASSIHAAWNGSPIVAHGNYDLLTHQGRAVISMPAVQQHRLFAMMVPQRVDIQGVGDITAKLTLHANGLVTGGIELIGKHHGFLQLHQIPLLRSVLAGTYGQALAAAMADDLHDYPFTQEHVDVTLTKSGMTFKLDFIRGQGNPMHLKARKVVIDGKTMIFRARDLKSVHLVIPVRNLTVQSLIRLLQKFSSTTKPHEVGTRHD